MNMQDRIPLQEEFNRVHTKNPWYIWAGTDMGILGNYTFRVNPFFKLNAQFLSFFPKFLHH